METYHYTVELPFSKKILNFREFTTEEQLALGKAQYSFLNDNVGYLNFVYSVISQCVKNKSDLEHIDIIEYLMFLLKIRIISVGQKIELLTKIEETDAKITIDLNKLLGNIYNSIETPYSNFIHKKTKVKIGFPYVKDISAFFSVSQHDPQTILETLPLFIKEINLFNIKAPSMTVEEKKKLYTNFPVSLATEIQTKVFDMIKNLSEKDIFMMEIFKDFRLNFYNNSFFELVKLTCSYDIKSIHQEIYLLSSLNPIYIRSISPSERKIYLAMYVQDKEKNRNTGDSGEINDKPVSPVDALALEFGQTPVNS